MKYNATQWEVRGQILIDELMQSIKLYKWEIGKCNDSVKIRKKNISCAYKLIDAVNNFLLYDYNILKNIENMGDYRYKKVIESTLNFVSFMLSDETIKVLKMETDEARRCLYVDIERIARILREASEQSQKKIEKLDSEEEVK